MALSLTGVSASVDAERCDVTLSAVCTDAQSANSCEDLNALDLRPALSDSTVPDPETEQKFWSRVSRVAGDGCWAWIGALTSRGYGWFAAGRRQVLAHRFSYWLVNGAIESGLVICHHCDNPQCVRPSHLFCGTPQDNTDDMIAKGRGRWQQ